MPRLHFMPDGVDAEAGAGEAVLSASLRFGIPHAHACGGHARCSTCRVWVHEGLEHCAPRNDREQTLAERLHFGPEIRLACQTTVAGAVTLRRLVLDAEDVQVVEQLASGTALMPVGEERSVAILFADIRGFTAFAEVLPAYDVMYVLNRYFHQIGQVIGRHGGVIDNYMGDGLMALFGVEGPEDAPLRAVRAGLEILAAVERLRPHLEALYDQGLRIGIGVHYGEVVVGSLAGSDACPLNRVTAIGDAVNFASRIESATKEAGVPFLISEATHQRVREHVVVGSKPVRLTIRGKKGKHDLYAVIGLRETNVSD